MTATERLPWPTVLRTLADRLEPIAPLLTRLMLGWAFVRTGFGKLTWFERTVGFFGDVGIPLPTVSAGFIATLELVGGACLCLGLGVRAFAALLSCTMLVATFTADWPQVLAVLTEGDPRGPIAVVPVLFLLFLLWLLADGGGLIGLDRLLARAWPQIDAGAVAKVRERNAQAGHGVTAAGEPRWRQVLRRPGLLAPFLHGLASLSSRLLVGWTLLLQGLAAPAGLGLLLLSGAVLLLLGLATRPVALLLALLTTVELLTSARPQLVEAAVPGGAIGLLEVTPLVLTVLLCWLAIRGGGRLALDRLVASRRRRAGGATAAASPHTRVLILGGGFGGMYAAMRLENRFAGDPGVEVTLVNQDNFLLFTPMLHEVAASDLDLTHIVSAARKLLRRTRFVNGEVAAIDLPGRRVTVVHGEEGRRHELRFDHLVLALGSITNSYGLPGVAEHAFTMRTLGDALALRNRLIGSMEEASVARDAAERQRLLTFVVAGGGFAGVETMAALNDFARETRRFYPGIDEDDIRMVLVHSGERILPELSPQLGVYAAEKLAERGVEVRLQARVKGLSAGGVALGDGTMLPTRSLVWTAGTAPHPLLATLPCPLEKGRLKVDATMAVPGHPGLWALGDCAVVPDVLREGAPCPPTAQHATRQGRVLADNIVAAIRGGSPREFRFRMLGQLAALGRRSGVAQVFGLRFSGFVAWWLWRSIYLSKLPGLERKVRVMLDWSLDLLFSKDLVKCPTDRGPLPAGEAAATPARPEPAVAILPR